MGVAVGVGRGGLTRVSLHLPVPPRISLHLLVSPCISLTVPRREEAAALDAREPAAGLRHTQQEGRQGQLEGSPAALFRWTDGTHIGTDYGSEGKRFFAKRFPQNCSNQARARAHRSTPAGQHDRQNTRERRYCFTPALRNQTANHNRSSRSSRRSAERAGCSSERLPKQHPCRSGAFPSSAT